MVSDQGYIALVAVHPGYRRLGIGSRLMHAARDRLADCPYTVLDGQCFNPFYGNASAPCTPLWGTSEGISVEWEDDAVRRFFAHFGFEPRYRAVTMETDVDATHRRQATKPPAEYQLEVTDNQQPILGDPTEKPPPRSVTVDALANTDRADAGKEFNVVVSHRNVIVGFLTAYPMVEISAERYAIYMLEVDEAHRGKGLGRVLLAETLSELARRGAAECEVLTLPSESPAAHALYQRFGFHTVQEWAIY